ncbi:MAG: hypothetical protein AVDCRST_MAG68-125, partial [uncultured Gemmatimonadetes bacterium]
DRVADRQDPAPGLRWNGSGALGRPVELRRAPGHLRRRRLRGRDPRSDRPRHHAEDASGVLPCRAHRDPGRCRGAAGAGRASGVGRQGLAGRARVRRRVAGECAQRGSHGTGRDVPPGRSQPPHQPGASGRGPHYRVRAVPRALGRAAVL